MKQQFFVGDKVTRNSEFDNMHGGGAGEIYEVTGVRNDGTDLQLDHSSVRSSCYYNIAERAWQKNTGVQPVDDDVFVEYHYASDVCLVDPTAMLARDVDWGDVGSITEWRIADNVPPVVGDTFGFGAVADEIIADVSAQQDWTDKHYDNNYTLTQKDIGRGFVKIDPYRVSKQWRLGSKDESGVLFHILKTVARFGEKNSREREVKALYAQIKCLAEIEGVDLNG